MGAKNRSGIGRHIFGTLFGIAWICVTFFMAKGVSEMNSSFEEDGMGFGPFVCIPWLFVIFGLIFTLANVYGVFKNISEGKEDPSSDEHNPREGMDAFDNRFGHQGPLDIRKKNDASSNLVLKETEKPRVVKFNEPDEKKKPGLVEPPPGSEKIEKEFHDRCSYCGAKLRDDLKFCPECLQDK